VQRGHSPHELGFCRPPSHQTADVAVTIDQVADGIEDVALGVDHPLSARFSAGANLHLFGEYLVDAQVVSV